MGPWIKWPQLPLLVQCAIVLGLLYGFGVKWSLVPPILEQATLILLLLVAALFHWWPNEEQLEAHLVAVKCWATVVLVLWLPCRAVYLGVNELGSLLDAASLLALLDVVLAVLVQCTTRWSLGPDDPHEPPRGTRSRLHPRHCLILSESFAGTVWFSRDSSSSLAPRIVAQCTGMASLAVWAMVCHHLDPVTLFPGLTIAQLLRSLSAQCVFTMMLLTALIGFVSTARTLDRHCVAMLAAFPQLHVPLLLPGSAFAPTAAGLCRAQVILVLAAMWSLHLAGASMLSLTLVLSAPLTKMDKAE